MLAQLHCTRALNKNASLDHVCFLDCSSSIKCCLFSASYCRILPSGFGFLTVRGTRIDACGGCEVIGGRR